MNIFKIIALFVFMTVWANARPSATFTNLDVTGDSLPAIRYMVDMKASGDTLLFVYEIENGYGRQFLSRAIIDNGNNKLSLIRDMGKSEDGYYASDMPYPVIVDNGMIQVVGRDDCEIYSVKNDTAFVGTRQYLMSGNSTVPFPLSQYVQDVFMTGRDEYVFIAREPKGGRQYAMKTNLETEKVDTVRQISISPQLRSWMPNTGEMAYSGKYRRLAFAYKLHPIIEIFDPEGNIVKSVRIGKDTFDPKTLDEADFEDLNMLHTVDITYTPDYIYALYWGFRFADAATSVPEIIKIDLDGNIVKRYIDLPGRLYRIAAVNDSSLIGWDGNNFMKIKLSDR